MKADAMDCSEMNNNQLGWNYIDIKDSVDPIRELRDY